MLQILTWHHNLADAIIKQSDIVLNGFLVKTNRPGSQNRSYFIRIESQAKSYPRNWILDRLLFLGLRTKYPVISKTYKNFFSCLGLGWSFINECIGGHLYFLSKLDVWTKTKFGFHFQLFKKKARTRCICSNLIPNRQIELKIIFV